MPRDQNGNYTLPPSNPVSPNTLIESAWANETMADLGQEMTNSLSRFGNGGMLVALRFVDGSNIQPGMSWNTDNLSGFYHTGETAAAQMFTTIFDQDIMRWTINGADVWDGSQWQPIISGEIDAVLVNYDISNQNIITAEEVQGALDQLSIGIEGVISGISFQGIWDASTDDPPGFPEIPEGGQMWVVSVPGNTILPRAGTGEPLTDWLMGERVIFVDLDVLPGWVRLQAISGVTAFSVSFVPQLPGIPSDNVQLAIQDVNNRVTFETALLVENNDFVGAQNTFLNVPQSLAPPVGINDLTRKDYVDTLIAAIPPRLVDSVFGRTGDVVAAVADYDAIQIEYNPFDNPISSATDVQTAIDDNAEAIAFLAGALILRGPWDALLNEPDIAVIPKVSGDYWIVDEEGSTVLPLYPDADPHDLPWLVLDRVLYLDNVGGTGFIQFRPESGDFLPITGGEMLGQIAGVAPAPVDAAHLTRKDYVDTAIGNIPPPPVTTVFGRAGTVVAVAADYTPAFIGAATAAQGITADSATQPGDNVSTLANDAGYITAASIPVTTVFGRAGAVVAVAADYTPAFIGAATTAQGALADSATQPGGNVSVFANDVPYATGTLPLIKAGQAIAGTGVVVTFSSPFPDTNYSVTLTLESNFPTADLSLANGTKTPTGFTIHNPDGSGGSVQWTAIAYV